MKKIHSGPVFAICVLKDGSLVTGGGKDGLLVHFDANYKNISETTLNDNLGMLLLSIRKSPFTKYSTHYVIENNCDTISQKNPLLTHFRYTFGCLGHFPITSGSLPVLFRVHLGPIDGHMRCPINF